MEGLGIVKVGCFPTLLRCLSPALSLSLTKKWTSPEISGLLQAIGKFLPHRGVGFRIIVPIDWVQAVYYKGLPSKAGAYLFDTRDSNVFFLCQPKIDDPGMTRWFQKKKIWQISYDFSRVICIELEESARFGEHSPSSTE